MYRKLPFRGHGRLTWIKFIAPMLTRLHIKNYALIEALDVSFDTGFTAITGETGSGKSILLGALKLVLGERADTHVLFDKSSKCIVEVSFDISALKLEETFSRLDLDYLDETSFRREISPNGRSRAFVNDTPVSLTNLRAISTKLIDIHSQHQTLLLGDEDIQLELLDTFSDNAKMLKAYAELFAEYEKTTQEISELRGYIKSNSIDKDYLLFQLDELSGLDLSAGEDGRVKEELSIQLHAEEIAQTLRAGNMSIEAESGLLDQLHDLSHKLNGISDYSQGLSELQERVSSLRIELEDISSTMADIASQSDVNPERKATLEARLDEYMRLFTKHGVQNVEGLAALKVDISQRLERAETSASQLAELHERAEKLHTKLSTQANQISASREKGKAKFVKRVSKRFADLNMPNAEIDVKLSQADQLHAKGIDHVEFLFNANKGGHLEVLSKVASGGELSRLMLLLKHEMAQAKHMPSLIFDEIDSGVSGEVASKMAGLLREMAADRQVISITHIPQVAARAMQHYRVSKSDGAERSITDLQVLDEDGRLLELAKMLSGTAVSEASVANARELMSN